jgi:hypothetical protein
MGMLPKGFHTSLKPSEVLSKNGQKGIRILKSSIEDVNSLIYLMDMVENGRDITPRRWNFRVHLKDLQAKML